MAKKILIMVLVFAMVAMAFAACQTTQPAGTGDTGDAVGTSDAGDAGDTGDTETDIEESVEPTKLVIYHAYVDSFNGAEGVAFRELLEQFQIDNPDIVIESQSVANDIYVQKIQTMGASDELPNIFPALPPMQGTFAKSGQILELGQFLDEDPEWRDSFIDGAFDDHTSSDGQIWASPYTSFFSHVIYYNKAIFDECGITYPTTLEELKTIIPIIKEKGYVPIALGNKAKAYLAACFQNGLVYRYIDPEWYASLKAGTGAKFTDPRYIEAIKALGELLELGAFNDDLNSVDQVQARSQYYGEGKAAMFCEGSWAISAIMTEFPREIIDVTEFALLPAPAATPELSAYSPGGTGWGWCISANSDEKQVDAALKFIKAMTGLENQTKIVDGGSEVVNKNATPTDPDNLDPFVAKYLDFKKDVILVGNPEIQLSALYVDASYTGYQNFTIGSITAEELAQALQDAFGK